MQQRDGIFYAVRAEMLLAEQDESQSVSEELVGERVRGLLRFSRCEQLLLEAGS
jgi:hypothetical protein